MDTLKKIADSDNLNANLIVLTDSQDSKNLIESSIELFAGRFSVWHLHSGRLTASDLDAIALKLLAQITELSVKRASLLALDGACNLATVLLAKDSQIVRRATFVDPAGRPRPGLWTRFREKLQSICPMPLPFHVDPDAIDLRHMQHRISCPLLVVKTADLAEEWSRQSDELAKRSPSAWEIQINTISSKSGDGSKMQLNEEFLKILEEFVEVPSKRSQKNILPAKKNKKSAASTLENNSEANVAEPQRAIG